MSIPKIPRANPKTGKVRVWDIHRKRYIETPPPNAREMFAVGSAVANKDDTPYMGATDREKILVHDISPEDVVQPPSKRVPGQAADAANAADAADEDDGSSKYYGLSKDELKTQIEQRQLEMPMKQNEIELIAILEASDSTDAAEGKKADEKAEEKVKE